MRDLTLDAIFGAFDEVFDKLYEESEIRFRRSDDEPVRHVRNDTFYFNYKGPLPAENRVKVDVTRGETVVSHWNANQCSAPTTNSLICQAPSCFRSTRSRKSWWKKLSL